MSTQVYGAGGWPLVPSKAFPGELTLACPMCDTTSVTMSAVYPTYGTGSKGQGRLGDPGGHSRLTCNNCKHTTNYGYD